MNKSVWTRERVLTSLVINQMANKNKNKTKKKGGKKKSVPRPQKTKMKTSMKTSVMYTMGVCSVTNPFCPEAVASRWPDNSYSKSSGWSISGPPVSVTNAAYPNTSTLFLPEGLQNVASAISNTLCTFANPSTFVQAWPSNVARYRITSWGLKVSSNMSKYTAQGTLMVRLFSPMNGSSMASVEGSTLMCDANYDIPISRIVDEDVFILPVPLGDNARLFRDIDMLSTTLATWENPGWQIVQLTVSGGVNSATNITVYPFYNLEFVFKDGEAASMFSTAPPPDSPAIRQGNSSVLAAVGNFFEGSARALDGIFKSRAARVGAKMALAGYSRNPMMLLDAPNVD